MASCTPFSEPPSISHPGAVSDKNGNSRYELPAGRNGNVLRNLEGPRATSVEFAQSGSDKADIFSVNLRFVSCTVYHSDEVPWGMNSMVSYVVCGQGESYLLIYGGPFYDGN